MHNDTTPDRMPRRTEPVDPDAYIVGELGPAQFTIANDDGARMVLDALVRYLADKPAEGLRMAVALVRTLPTTMGAMIDLGSRNRTGQALVASLPNARTNTTRCSDGAPLCYALAEIDGVEIAARYNPGAGS